MQREESGLRIRRDWIIYGGLAAAALIAVIMRWRFLDFVSADQRVYLKPWYAHIQQNGFSSFETEFANYNLPYLYLLYLASLLDLSSATAIKGISGVFDLFLAGAIFLLLREMNRSKQVALAGAVAGLYLPTVFLNSAAWGQCDSIYTAFLLLAFRAILRKNSLAVWAFWGLAFIFKLQAIFILPFLLIYWLVRKDGRWYDPLVVVPIFFVPFIPALIAGRSFSSILSIYQGQAIAQTRLSLLAPNPYTWFGNNHNDIIASVGVPAAAGIALLFVVAVIYLRIYQVRENWILIAVASLTLMPFVLPYMHDRYWYPAEVFAFVAAFTVRRIWVAAVLLQFTGLTVYLQYLFGTQTISLQLLAIVQGIALLYLVVELVRRRAQDEPELPALDVVSPTTVGPALSR